MPVNRQISWLLLLRLLVASLLLGGTIIYHVHDGDQERSRFLVQSLYGLVVITYLGAAASFFIARVISSERFFLQLQVTWDILFSISLVYITGGSESPFVFLFIIAIIGSSVFFSRKEIFLVASASSILYGSLVDLQYYGYLPYAKGSIYLDRLETRDFFYAVFVNLVAFFLTALLSSILAERLRRSEFDLRKKEIDYDDLDYLNKTIVSSISSGLMSLNAVGRVRLFNAAASTITGLQLKDVYDRDVRTVIPGLQEFPGGLRNVRRGEIPFQGAAGRWLTLGYATSLLTDAKGREKGLLVSFQDLTEFKEMEQRLRRADRLATVGRLASGMAHEIRNPLASISGSVQLLLELKEMDDYQKRLMQIVVKEADRLNLLLTDFLLFARPKRPEYGDVDFLALCDEIVAVSAGDPRFQDLDVQIAASGAVRLKADRQQLRQALWNVLLNAAEALVAPGTIKIELVEGDGWVSVEVADSGTGIPDAIREKIFDPFFSTKDRGSGLGLATVHAIVQAHCGEIDVRNSPEGGARFVLRFPQTGNGDLSIQQ